MYNHGKQIVAEQHASIRAYKQDRVLLRIAVVLLVVAFVGIGFCVAYGIQIGNADLLATMYR